MVRQQRVFPQEKVNLWEHMRPRTIAAKALQIKATFCLGGLSFLAFVVLMGTGLLLAFHYQPGEQAFSSLVEIETLLPYGGILRSLHFWAAQFMVFTVLLHMVRVVWHQAYRPPRELNWLVGMALFLFTIILDFSGYLLRGNQESGAASTVGQALLTGAPGGTALAPIFFGTGSMISGSTLAVYVWHCFLLPGASTVFIIWHFWRIRRDGGVRPL